MEIKFDNESLLELYLSLHEVLHDYVSSLSITACDSLTSLYDVVGVKLLASLESDCDVRCLK